MINVGCGSCGARSALSPSPAAPTTTGAPRSNLQNLTDTTPLRGVVNRPRNAMGFFGGPLGPLRMTADYRVSERRLRGGRWKSVV